ncbi:MAG: hypothetical protein JNM34_04090, partial [Chthonomonadaceae bacterium]|nr:hypothetical protein [Chthonomonadaceae bacterium]
MVIALVAACLAPRLQQDPEITYRTVAAPVSKVLSELSSASGAKLTCTPDMAKEIIVVAVKSQPLSVVKAKIADVVVGSWAKQSDGGETLSADGAKRSAASRASLILRTANFEKDLKRLAKSLNPRPKPKDQGEEELSYSAGQKLLATVASNLTAADLASLKPGDRVVYATSPTRSQLQLRAPGLEQAVAAYVKDHNTQVSKSELDRGSMDEKAKAALAKIEALGLPGFEKPINGQPSKILLVAEVDVDGFYSGDTVSLKALILDTNGDVVANEETSVGRGIEVSRDEASLVGEDKSVNDQDKDKPQVDPRLKKAFELSPLSSELAAFDDIDPTSGPQKNPSPELVSRLLQPDVYDPHSFAESEGTIALADALESNLVAYMSDSESGSMMTFHSKSIDLAELRDSIAADSRLTFESKDGWMTIKPKDIVRESRSRFDRKDLSKLLGSTKDSMSLSLDALAAYAVKNPPLDETPPVETSLMVLSPGSMLPMAMGKNKWPVLRLYGSLSASERATLRAGNAVQFSRLTPGPQNIVRRLVFGAGTRLQTGPTDDKLKLPWMFMEGSSRNKSFKSEPTEVMPGGLPGQGAL